MSRDLAGDVERLMKAGNSYVKKKVRNGQDPKNIFIIEVAVFDQG